MNLNEKLKLIEKLQSSTYYGDRVASELLYINRVSICENGKYDADLEAACDYLLGVLNGDGAVCKDDVLHVEEMLTSAVEDAKKYKAYCVSHAHIDMNWKWGYQETVAVVIETFRTMLMLMKEYPDFTYSQSQASVYRIIEKYAPEMLEEIKKRIKEGRWEVSASTWTECDKNMPNGESLVRQTLYTKRYLSKLLDIDPDSLNLDFEPDTFGHNKNMPEILSGLGVDYYYHCRGCDYSYVYRWVSDSGKEIIVYQEPKWYLGPIDSKGFCDYPIFCRDVCHGGLPIFLKVYGVGDHGGGPTRRDIERIIDMSTWPLFPTIKFSSYREFFGELEKYRSKLPVIKGELNFVFTGCYTTQSRIKMANRLSEARLYDAEMLSSEASALTDAESREGSFASAWENVIFSQFHDILPGSGVLETREFCLGGFQDTMSYANANANAAMHAIADNIDTTGIEFDPDIETTSEGGGVGFRIDNRSGYQFTSAEMGRGRTRVFHIFNTLPCDRKEFTEITLFDYVYDLDNIEIVNTEGESVAFKAFEINRSYNQHRMTRIWVDVDVPALGYSTYILRQKKLCSAGRLEKFEFRKDPRRDKFEDSPIVLENSKIKAVFDPASVSLISLVDKKSGREAVSAERPCGVLRYTEENNQYGMSAWRVGPVMNSISLNNSVNVKVTDITNGSIIRSISYEIKYKQSIFNVVVSLIGENDFLDYEINADWHEIGSQDTCVPQLSFSVPVAYKCTSYRYDVPFGKAIRPPLAHDVPALSYMEMLDSDDNGMPHIMIATDTKYGYRGYDDCGSVTLLRSAFNPDPLPEAGKFRTKVAIAFADSENCAQRIADRYCHRMPYTSGLLHTGDLPLSASFLKVSGNVSVSAVKHGEDGGTVIRLFENSGKDECPTLKFCRKVAYAALTDSNEKEICRLVPNGDELSVKVEASSVVTVKVNFE